MAVQALDGGAVEGLGRAPARLLGGLPREERRAAFQAVDLRDQRILPQPRGAVKEIHSKNRITEMNGNYTVGFPNGSQGHQLKSNNFSLVFVGFL